MKNEGFILLNLYALIILVILSIIFFSKKRLHQIEDNTYGNLLISSVITILFGLLLGIYLDLNVAFKEIIIIFNKIYLAGLVITISIFAFYTFCISRLKYKKFNIIKRGYQIFCFLNALIIFLLPLEINTVNNSVVTSGLSMTYTYIIFSLIYLLLLILVLSDLKNIRNRKYIPIIFLIFEGVLITTIMILFPSMNYIINPSTVLTCLIMYFTIENPDVKMINQLNLAKDTAEKANRAKSDFLSSMSHEIRTPLNAIVGLSECIKQSDNIEEAIENANDVITASNTLLEIVNGILDISKIESGKLELVEKNYNCRKMFEEVEKLTIARIGEKPLQFKMELAEDLPENLYGDPLNIKKILINLLTNAVKYTEKGYVWLNVRNVKIDNNICKLIISVKDTGRGIKKENIDKLFTKFQRLDEDRNTTIEGTGLGLAITKRLVEMMGGKIIVNSIYGEGSDFTVILHQKISLDKTEVLSSYAKSLEETLDLSNKKILIVDDNKLNLKVAQKLLIKYNPKLEVCESGFDCIEKIKAGNNYDLILMDDMMPKMSGIETLNELKKLDNFNVKVIALTANAISGVREKYLSAGFSDYLAKPIEKNELHNILLNYIDYKSISNVNNNDTISTSNIKEEPEEEISYNDFSGKKILIVDDNKINVKIASKILLPYKLTIDEALSGFDCIERIKAGNNYDLIFMDYMMPELDGIETLKKLKEIPNFNIHVIALTADAVEGAREKFLNSGFDEYISKPIDKNYMDKVINKFLKDNNSNEKSIGDISTNFWI